MKKPELLLPAGNLEKLKVGIEYGGDAFYLGFAPFSMRCTSTGFTKDDLLEGVDLIRKKGKDFYMTMNIFPRGNKIDVFKKHIEFVRKHVKPDGVIVADPGLFSLLREFYPEGVLHISVQANVLNYMAVEFWRKQGAKRIILPRELMLSEIREIHEKVPNIELECFVHGSICMAYSGRCLLSNYMTGRDSNQGACAHSCRWKYKVNDEDENRVKPAEPKRYFLEEEKRPGEMMEIEEDEHGTYIMNAKDNCLLPHLKDLVEAGVCSFKVEGRNKTEYYLSTVANAYRKAIDDMVVGKEFDKTLMDEVAKTANRGFIPGYLFGFPGDVQDIEFEKDSVKDEWKYAGMIEECLGKGSEGFLYKMMVKNRFEVGREVEIMVPGKNFMSKVLAAYDLKKEPVSTVHGGTERIVEFAEELPRYAMVRMRNL